MASSVDTRIHMFILSRVLQDSFLAFLELRTDFLMFHFVIFTDSQLV